MSDVVLQCIADYAPMIHERLFGPDTPKLVIPASAVNDPEAAADTQTERARALDDVSWLQPPAETIAGLTSI